MAGPKPSPAHLWRLTLRLAQQRNMPAEADYRIAFMRGAPEQTLLAEEEAAITPSVRYCRETLRIV